MPRIVFALLLVALGFGVSAGAAFGVARVVRLGDDAGGAVLVVPASCERVACPLVVVSHRRGGRAADAVSGDPAHAAFARFLSAFSDAGFVLLLSDDAGPETWGNEAALEHLRAAWSRARSHFVYSGETFSMGVSMGGLPAALAALRRVLPVRGVVLVDPRLNLREAMSSASGAARRASVEAAYGLGGLRGFTLVPAGHDVVNDFWSFPRRAVPALVVASPDDSTVPMASNGALFVDLLREAGASARLLVVRGEHLGAAHLSGAVAAAAVDFLVGLRLGAAEDQRPKRMRDSGEPLTRTAKTSGSPSVRTYSVR